MPTEPEIRDEIFRLRGQDPPVSIRKIAAELQISTGRVQRELSARATKGGENGAVTSVELATNGATPPPPAPPANYGGGIDPELSMRRQAIERRRLALAEQDLELRALEQEKRIEALRRAAENGGGGDARFAELVIGELRDLRSRIDRPAGNGSQSVVSQLTEMKQATDAIAALAPPRAPTSALDLEFNLASMRVSEESRRLLAKQELEAATEKVRVEGEAARNHAIAGIIESQGPTLITAALEWFNRQNKPAAPVSIAAPGPIPPPMLGGDAGGVAGAVKGFCPRCGAGELEIVPTGTEQDACPACGLLLAVEGGQIVSREMSPPAPEVARYAS